MAEGLLTKALGNKQDCVISSAGINAVVGHKPDDKACQLMLDKGIDISQYRACQLNTEMIRKSDLILVMESFHKSAIEAKDSSAKGKVFQLGKWNSVEIPDPYGQDLQVFKSTLQLIEKSVDQWLNRL
jgi:protein-tyrosine phosphatase